MHHSHVCSLLTPFVMYSTSNKPERLHEILNVVNIEPLSEDEIQAIEKAGYEKHHRTFVSRLSIEMCCYCYRLIVPPWLDGAHG